MFVRQALACVPLLCGLFWPTRVDAQARTLTLADALHEAQSLSPELRMAKAEVAVARADLTAAGLPAYNPEAAFSIGPSTNADTTITSFDIGLSQTIELGGKRGRRTDAAEQRVAAATARQQRAQQQVRSRVTRAFGLALVAEARAGAAAEGDSVAAALRVAAEERLRLGAGTVLEVNVAAAAAARERRNRFQAEQARTAALLELGAAIGLSATQPVVPEGELPIGVLPALPEDSLVVAALGGRPDLAAAAAQTAAAAAELRLAGALAWPDPTLGVSGGQSEDFRVFQVGITMPLPLWNHGQGAKAQATANLDVARIGEATARRGAEREVREAYRGLISAVEAERAFDREAVGRMRENLTLAEESFRAGKIGLFAYNSVRRDLVEARLAYLDAVAEVIERQAALVLAVGAGSEPIE